MNKRKRITYKSSGVDIKKANQFVGSIACISKATFSSGVLKNKGGFGSLFQISPKAFKNPVLVSSTDGVGTKLMIAKLAGTHDTVGIDLVAMNVNDILCCGARPLFFLDYIACGILEAKVLKAVMKGIAAGCREAGCSLIGGETAEMPGLYKEGDYDLAGFALGAVEKKKIINGRTIAKGDKIIGLASSGLHSNGFSLARKVFSLSQQKKLAPLLLKPTKIYVKPILKLLNHYPVKGMAHVTGGAFYEKVTKIIPPGKCFSIDKRSWRVPEIFKKIQNAGNVPEKEMYTTFNMGIGMVLVVSAKAAGAVMAFLKKQPVRSFEIGEVTLNTKKRVVL